jgi:hypothetical protein
MTSQLILKQSSLRCSDFSRKLLLIKGRPHEEPETENSCRLVVWVRVGTRLLARSSKLNMAFALTTTGGSEEDEEALAWSSTSRRKMQMKSECSDMKPLG